MLASKWWLACFVLAACGSDSEGVFDASPPPPSPCPSCQLLAVSPATAGKGARITIEGTFGEAATVEFANGITTNAMVLGPHRISALVPLNTDGGSFVVHVGSTTLGPIEFRRASFEVTLGAFETDPVQVGVARTRAHLVTARRDAASVLGRGGLFVFGGSDGNADLASVERALVNADGSLAPFAASDVALVHARHGHAATLIGNRVVVTGGAGVAAADGVELADLGGDGKLGGFRAGGALTGERAGHTAVVIGNYLYLIGGANAAGPVASVERAAIALDGSLGAFTDVPGSQLAVARAGHTSAVVSGFVYVVGGSGAAGALASVERAPINPDGTLGAFAAVTSTLATARSGHTMTAFDDVVYVIGGAGAGALASVERAVLNPDGSLGPFAAADVQLAGPRSGQTSTVIGDYIYVVGGAQGGAVLASTERATFVGAATPQPFSAGRLSGFHQRGSAIIAVGRFIYAFGGDDLDSGENHVNKVARAEVPDDTDIVGFQVVLDNRLVHGRTGHTAAVIGDYVYVLGGSDGGADPLPTERALVRADGSLGAFADVSPTIARSGHTAAVHGDSLYVFGGRPAGELASVDRLRIAADGSLGAPERQTQAPPASVGAASGSTTLALDDKFYVIGGLGADGLPARAQYAAAFQPDGTLGAFTEVTAVGQGRARNQSVVVGPQLLMFGGVIDNEKHDATAIPNTALRLPFASDGSLGTQALFPFVAPEGGSATLIGNYVFIFGSLVTRAQLRSP